MRDLSGLSDRLEAIAVGGLAALDLHPLDAGANEAHLIDHLCALELQSQLLREHARRQPEGIVVPGM